MRAGQAESAVQLYFAAMSHRTTEIMRLLTLITAIFMPLTLITGIFGMNFDVIPGLHKSYGFWLALAVLLPAILLGALAMRQGVRVDAPVRLSPP